MENPISTASETCSLIAKPGKSQNVDFVAEIHLRSAPVFFRAGFGTLPGVVVVLRLLMTYEDLVQKPAEQIHRTLKNQLWDGLAMIKMCVWTICIYL